jgi:ubiquinone/menaquinone biosynthesis C-methylase UbiE
VKQYYDTRAPEYDDWWLQRGLFAGRDLPGWAEERDTALAAVAALPAKRTLDAACGTGFVTRLLQGEVVGLDQSSRMLDEARKQAPDATFVEGDGIELPFEDDSFERVFTSHFYGHIEDPDRTRFLAEARRVAPELVVFDAGVHFGAREERQRRVLNDGSEWQVYKRFFAPDTLLAELSGGEVLHAGTWFILVRS